MKVLLVYYYGFQYLSFCFKSKESMLALLIKAQRAKLLLPLIRSMMIIQNLMLRKIMFKLLFLEVSYGTRLKKLSL